MINKVGRDIPDEILERYGKEGYNGPDYRNGTYYVKAAPRVRTAWKVPERFFPPCRRHCLNAASGTAWFFHFITISVMETTW